MSAAHSPGPWVITPSAEDGLPAFCITQSITHDWPLPVAEAYRQDDAHLIAAAPDLLEALKELIKAEDRVDGLAYAADTYGRESARNQMNDAMQAARAAIAKATGGAA